jgi:hypothetical protein
MAQYEHLPIYRDAFKFLIFCEDQVQRFSRYHKYTHGADLRNSAREMVKLIIRANNTVDKTAVLEELRLSIEEILLVVRVCKEIKAFPNFKAFETAVEQISVIGRQTEGWLKSVRRRESGPKRVPDGHP